MLPHKMAGYGFSPKTHPFWLLLALLKSRGNLCAVRGGRQVGWGCSTAAQLEKTPSFYLLCFTSMCLIIWTHTNQERTCRCYILSMLSIKSSLEVWFSPQESLMGLQGLPLHPTSRVLLLPAPLKQHPPSPEAAMERTEHFSAFSAHLNVLHIPLNNCSEDFNVATTFLYVAITDFVLYFITHANSCLQSSDGGMQSSGYTDYSFIQRDYTAVNSIWTSI